MIQCKDSIVILRRSEERRRICNLSPNRSFAYAQDDKVGLSRWGGRSLRGMPGDSRMFAGLRRLRLRPARLKRAEERRNDNRSKPLFAPSAAFLLAIALCACCGLPQHDVGSLGERRYGRALVAFVVFCDRQSPRRLARLRDGERELAWVAHSLVRCLRALRPASTRLLLITRNRIGNNLPLRKQKSLAYNQSKGCF